MNCGVAQLVSFFNDYCENIQCLGLATYAGTPSWIVQEQTYSVTKLESK